MKYFSSTLVSIFCLVAIASSQTPSNVQSIQDLPALLTSPTNAGTEFYFSFPPCFEEESNSSNSCRVFVTSSVSQLVTVQIDGKGWLMTKGVSSNEITEFVIPYTLAQPYLKSATAKIPEEKIYPDGAVRVFAQAPIIVYGVTRYTYSGDGFLALPVSALGTDYIVASYPPTGTTGSNYKLSSETTISAAYDSTVVKFEMGGTATSTTSGGLLPGHDTVFTMNKGDVLCFASNGFMQDLSGSRITSNRPVAVVSGTQCANVPIDIPWCDYLSEMELPTYSWGREYHVTPILGRKKNSMIRIYAKEPNTTVFRDGIPWLYLPNSSGIIDDGYADRRVDDSLPRPVVITADLPIYVVEYNSGQAEDNIVSDPFQMVLTPYEQYQNEIVFATPGTKTSSMNFTSHYVNLIYELGSATNVPDDVEFATVVKGTFEWNKLSTRFGSTPGMIFSIPIHGKTYACKQLTLPEEGVYSIRAKSPIAAYMYGFTKYDSYGFPASVKLYNSLIKDTVAPVITWTQDCDGSVRNGHVKDYPDNSSMRTNLGALYMDPPMDSSYNYTFAYGKNRQFIAGETRETDWTLTVIDPWKKARATLRFIDRNGNTTTSEFTYTPQKFTLSPPDYLNFGVTKRGQSITKNITLTNETPQDAVITKLELQSDTLGFTIDNALLPLTLHPGESREITITFVPSSLGFFTTHVGLGDSCKFGYPIQISAEVVTPIIAVNDYNFQLRAMKSRTSWTQLLIKNTGRVALFITGDDHLSALKSTPEFQPVNWNLIYPLTLQPQESIALQVDYVPTKKGITTARITFSSDATTLDSTCILNGTGIDSTTNGVNNESAASSHATCTLGVSPNPIGASGGVVEFTMQSHGFAELTLVSSTGERVATLVQSEYDKGNYQVRIPVELLSSGSYIVRMVVGNFSLEKAVVIVK